jgi:hypothetical protein
VGLSCLIIIDNPVSSVFSGMGEWIKRWGHISLTAEIAELAEKIREILSVLCGLSGEMVRKAHEHSHSPGWRGKIILVHAWKWHFWLVRKANIHIKYI